jgi:hypothetical protein
VGAEAGSWEVVVGEIFDRSNGEEAVRVGAIDCSGRLGGFSSVMVGA